MSTPATAPAAPAAPAAGKRKSADEENISPQAAPAGRDPKAARGAKPAEEEPADAEMPMAPGQAEAEAEAKAEQDAMDAAMVAAADEAEVMATAAARWPRPPLPPLNPAEDALALQWIDVDMYVGEPLRRNPCAGQPVKGATRGAVPIIRFYGVTEAGNSVTAHVHGFTPYLFASAPPGLDESMLGAYRAALEARVAAQCRERCETYILGVELVSGKQSLMGYHPEGSRRNFVLIYTALPKVVPTVRSVLGSELDVPGLGCRSYQTFESNVPFVLRFMIDRNIVGCNWLELPAGTYSLRSDADKVSRAQAEVDVVFDNMLSHEPVGAWSKVAPFRILSFDIECMGRRGHFPEAEKDPVIQIANVVTRQGDTQPIVKNVFVLDTCLPIVGAQVLSFANEGDMLDAWASFLRTVDADIITGYNVQNFDVPYLLNRAAKLKLRNFAYWGRIVRNQARMRDTTFSSAAYGRRDNVETTIEGRCIFDTMQYMLRGHKLSSYSLNSVSAHFLGQQKEDVHHSIISDLQRGSDEDRRRLAVYCIKDAMLPQQLLDKLSVIVNHIEMARVTGVPLDFLLTRGQQIKVMSMLLRKCRAANLLIPVLPREQGDQTYDGATVIEPEKGFYQTPIATLDFASLYPSIMQAYNLCYSTLVTPAQAEQLAAEGKEVERSPTGHFFIKSTVRRGILPEILESLLRARKQAKRDMAAATDPMEKAVQNGRQLALKVSANSVYGFTGATVGQLPCIPIAASVTSYGRQLLELTKQAVEEDFAREHNLQGVEVIYGDTDSVMVKFGVEDMPQTMELAAAAADFVSERFPRPILLEFEKVYLPYLLMNKKRYAGLLWTKPEKFDYMDSKGLETVRRDNCLLVRQLVDTCLRRVLIHQDVPGAIAYATGVISDLLQNRIDISCLVITKALSKTVDDKDYVAKQAHVELAARMKRRDPGTAPQLGDRVPYVIVEAAKGTPAFAKSEDPIYVLENNIPIDAKYYLTNQLSNPLMRIFTPILGEARAKSQLLAGDHTRVVRRLTPEARAGGIMAFAVRKKKCLACKTPVADSESLCQHCAPREGEIIVSKLQAVNDAQQLFSRLWTQCQRCQGSLHQDVLCASRDCPIFYKRVKVQKDLRAAQEELDRFSW